MSERFVAERSEFALRLDGTAVHGYAQLDGRRISLDEISAVLYRPAANSPCRAGAIDERDAFQRHERAAAWCAIFDTIPCAVINRPGPEWWAGDAFFNGALVLDFSAATGIDARPCHRSSDAQRSAKDKTSDAYMVGDTVLCAAPARNDLTARLAAHATELRQWQADTGIAFARIEFDSTRDCVTAIDPFPDINEPAALLDKVSAQLADLLR